MPLLWGGSAWTIYRNMPARRSPYSYWFARVTATVAALGHALRTDRLRPADRTDPGAVAVIGMGTWLSLAIGVLVVPSMTLGMIVMIHDRMLAERELEANQEFLTGLLSRKAWWREGERRVRAGVAAGPAADAAGAGHRPLQAGQRPARGMPRRRCGAAAFPFAGHRAAAAAAMSSDGWAERSSVALLPDTDSDTGVGVAERLLAAVRAHADTRTATRRWLHTFSGGVAQYRAGDTLPVLVERADAALYAAKPGRPRPHQESLADARVVLHDAFLFALPIPFRGRCRALSYSFLPRPSAKSSLMRPFF